MFKFFSVATIGLLSATINAVYLLEDNIAAVDYTNLAPLGMANPFGDGEETRPGTVIMQPYVTGRIPPKEMGQDCQNGNCDKGIDALDATDLAPLKEQKAPTIAEIKSELASKALEEAEDENVEQIIIEAAAPTA